MSRSRMLDDVTIISATLVARDDRGVGAALPRKIEHERVQPDEEQDEEQDDDPRRSQ